MMSGRVMTQIARKILVCGLPGSGKSTFSSALAKATGGIHLNADEIRDRYHDWCFGMEGRLRQANRMRHLADGIVLAGGIAIADFVAPTEEARLSFGADYTVFMNVISESRYEDTNKIFQPPMNADFVQKEWVDYADSELFTILLQTMGMCINV